MKAQDPKIVPESVYSLKGVVKKIYPREDESVGEKIQEFYFSVPKIRKSVPER